MIANIPLILTEALSTRELGALLDLAEQDRRPVEDLFVLAMREYIESRKIPQPPKAPKSEPVPAAA